MLRESGETCPRLVSPVAPRVEAVVSAEVEVSTLEVSSASGKVVAAGEKAVEAALAEPAAAARAVAAAVVGAVAAVAAAATAATASSSSACIKVVVRVVAAVVSSGVVLETRKF